MDTKIKINNERNNVYVLHNKMFPKIYDNYNGSILICSMGNPLHYKMLREQYQNLEIYGIESDKLEQTFKYCQNELNCNIVFLKNTGDIREWNRCIKKNTKEI